MALSRSQRCTKKMSQWCSRLELWGLGTVGLLGLCYLLSRDEWLGLSAAASPEPSPSAAAGLPAPSAEPPAPCTPNASVHNISGFATLPGHVQDFLRYKHCRAFAPLLDVPGKCGGPARSPGIFLLLAIKSSPENYVRRETIRKTWGQERWVAGVRVRRLFLCGVAPGGAEAPKLNRLLQLEQREHGDILQWDFRDTFFNLTLKQVLFHTWLEENCPGVHFVFNGDDDVFVNTDNVVRFALSAEDGHLFVGHLITNVGPIRSKGSKYYVPPQVMASERYPPYCGGGGMVMSGFTARTIYRESRDIELFPIDDVYLGMCLEKAGLAPASHSGIRTTGIYVPSRAEPFDPCYYRELLLVHRFAPYEMALMWQAIREPGLRCGRMVGIYPST
ncbi:N-acetyllactosaminide beta-1,3-N-acetylglucosaminyltransferase 3 [Apteryx mantelli]|uniref:Hexosyltransferase n=1 Tax=Apteryx mantelli TaxID=2696672 RepID=A0ABM4FVA5_9AVES